MDYAAGKIEVCYERLRFMADRAPFVKKVVLLVSASVG